MHRHIGDAVQLLEQMKGFVEKESVLGLRSRLGEVRLSLGFLANEIKRMEDAHEADRAARERMAFSAKMRQANDGGDDDDVFADGAAFDPVTTSLEEPRQYL